MNMAMNRPRCVPAGLLIIGIMMASPGWAQTAQRVGIVVGSNTTVVAGLEPLRYADDDAALYYRLLRPHTAGLTLLTTFDDASQRRHPKMARMARAPTKANLMESLRVVYEQIRELQRHSDDSVEFLFIYVGHGSVDDEGKGYVHLEDAPLSRADLFAEIIAASPADFTHVVVDACNAFSLLAGRGETSDAPSALFEDFLAGHELADYPNVGVLIATSEDRKTHEWSRIGAGIFSHQVRAALTGAADINGDRRLEYSEVGAFIDASNADLKQAGKKLSTFAWPPARDRRRPILELVPHPELRRVTLASTVTGRIHIEDGAGERLVELNGGGDRDIEVWLPRSSPLFVRAANKEQEIDDLEGDVRIDVPPHAPYTIAERGAVDRAFEESLFAVPLSPAYYRGYLSGHPQMIAVELDSASIAHAQPSTVSVTVAYRLAYPPIARNYLEHGGAVRAEWMLGSRWELSGVVEGGVVPARQSASVSRWAAALGVAWRQPIAGNWSILGGLELGAGLITIHGASSSSDTFVPLGRLRAGVGSRPTDGLGLEIGAAATSQRLTLNGAETLRHGGEFLFGVRWL